MSQSPSSDFDLLEAWRQGDQASGDQLLGRHFSVVYRFFRTKLSEEAKDLTQRTFLACVESRDKFRADASFRSYLFGIARNTLLSHLRSRYRRERVIELGDVSAHDFGPSPSKHVAQHEEQRLLLKAMRRIPLDFQIALELFYWEELPVKDIAAVLDVPEGTVRSRLTRAREHLRRNLEQLASSPELADTTMGNLEKWGRSLQGLLADSQT